MSEQATWPTHATKETARTRPEPDIEKPDPEDDDDDTDEETTPEETTPEEAPVTAP